MGPKDVLSTRAATRLMSLELIEVSGAGVRLTPVGRERYSALPDASIPETGEEDRRQQ